MAKTWSYKVDAVQREKFCKWLGGYLLELSGRQLVDDFGNHYHLVAFCPRQEPDRHDIKSFPVWFSDRLAKEQNLSFIGFTVEFLCEDGDLFDLNFYFVDAGAIDGLPRLYGKIRLTLTMTGSDDKFSKLYSEIDRRIEKHFPGSREEPQQETEPPTTAEVPAAEQPAEQKTRGIKLGTDARVTEFHRLVKGGHSHRLAKAQAHCDPTTYYRWCKEVTGEDPIEPYR